MSDEPIRCDHRVAFEPQSLPYSCAAKALQLVLHFHAPQQNPLGVSGEYDLLERAKLGRFPTATHSGTILVALQEGFGVTHWVRHPDVFTYPNGPVAGTVMPRAEFDEKVAVDRHYFARADRLGRRVEVLSALDPAALRHILRTAGPAIAMTDHFGGLHDVVVTGYDGDTFLAVDPIRGLVRFASDHLVRLVQTRYGVSLITLHPKPLKTEARP